MKKVLIPLFCLFVLNLFSDTYVSGNVSGTWNVAGSPYRATGNITVASSSTLTIEDNVQVIFENDYLFTVNGTLDANRANFSLIVPHPPSVYSWQGIEFTSSSSNCIIDSCDFDNASPGIVFTNTSQSNYPLISNSTFDFLNHATVDADYALKLTDDSEPVVDNNDFEGYILGIYIDANLTAAEPEITNNEFNLIGLRLTRQSHSKGGVFEDVSNAYLDNNDFLGFEKGLEITNSTDSESVPKISNTRVRSSSRNLRLDEIGVKIVGFVSVEIDSCQVTAYNNGITLLNASSSKSNPKISNTRVRSSSRSTDVGLFMYGNMSSEIWENTFADCDSAVVIMGDETESELTKNNMFLTAGVANNVAILAEDSDSLLIYNNTIDSYDIGFYSDSTNTDFQNNIVWHDSPTVEPVQVDTSEVNVIYNDIARPSGIYPGTGNINSDPLFSDPANEDFSLQWGSPCIDAGNPSLVFQDDDGTTSDMGAFFYCQGPCPVEFSSFTAQFINNSTKLSWMTATETNNLGWNIYRGEQESALQNDETIQINNELIEGAGTTTEPSEYYYFDEYDLTLNFTYWYWLESMSLFGTTEIYGPKSLFIPEHEDNPDPPDPSEQFGLFQNYPNPFHPGTKIGFRLPKDKHAELIIYNVKGEKIITLFKGKTTNDYPVNIYWDAHDKYRKQVKSGIYLYRLVSGDYVQTRKMIYLR